MKTELRKVKIAESLSRDSTAFTADLIVDDEHIAYLRDDGRGGAIFIDHAEGCRDKVQAFEEWCETLPPRESYEDLPMSAELFIGDLLEEWEENKFLKRLCRTKTVIRLEGDRAGEYTTFKKAYDAEFAKYLRSTETGLVEIYNERFLS
jgi:hypothetical protein